MLLVLVLVLAGVVEPAARRPVVAVDVGPAEFVVESEEGSRAGAVAGANAGKGRAWPRAQSDPMAASPSCGSPVPVCAFVTEQQGQKVVFQVTEYHVNN